jgi:hypothetical protein
MSPVYWLDLRLIREISRTFYGSTIVVLATTSGGKDVAKLDAALAEARKLV